MKVERCGFEFEISEAMRFSYSAALKVINNHLSSPVPRITLERWIVELNQILMEESSKVRLGHKPLFTNIEISETQSKTLSFDFVCYLVVLAKIRQQLKDEAPKNRKTEHVMMYFWEENINKLVDRQIVGQMFFDEFFSTGGKPLFGKYFRNYLELIGIKVSDSSLYKWSASNSDLPKFDRAAKYTLGEFNQWRDFIRNRPKRQYHFSKVPLANS